jgi:hypothetical protein
MKLDRKLLLPASGGGTQAKTGFVPDLLQPMTSCIEDQPVIHPAKKRTNQRVRGIVYINSSPASATTNTDISNMNLHTLTVQCLIIFPHSGLE